MNCPVRDGRVHRWSAPAATLLLLWVGGCPTPTPATGPGIREADRLLSEGNPVAALTAYQTALDQPPPGHGLRGVGLCYEAMGRRADAISALEQARAVIPGDAVVRLALGRLYVAAERKADAAVEARYVFDHHPENLTALILLGALAESGAEVQQALERLESWRRDPAIKRLPVAELFIAVSDLSARKGDARAASQALTEAARTPLGNADAAVMMSGVYVSLGRTQAAEQLLLAVVRADPKRADAQRRLAFLAADLDHYAIADKAISTFESDPRKLDETVLRARVKVAMQQAPSVLAELRDRITRSEIDHATKERRAQLQYWLGKALTQTGDLANAKLALSAAATIWPEMIPAHLALAELRLRDREVDAAIAGLESVVATQPTAADLHGVLGSAYMTKGDYVRAEAAFRRRAELTPKDAAGAHLIGVALTAQGKNDPALEQFRRALELDPAAVDPLEALVSILMTEHKQDEAEALHQRAVSAAPDRIEAWISLSRFYQRVGNRPRASAVIQQAVRLAPEHQAALSEAAQVAVIVGDYAEAERLAVRLLALQPNHVPALNNLAVLYDEHLNHPEKALEMANRAHALAPNDPHVQHTLDSILRRRSEHAPSPTTGTTTP